MLDYICNAQKVPCRVILLANSGDYAWSRAKMYLRVHCMHCVLDTRVGTDHCIRRRLGT